MRLSYLCSSFEFLSVRTHVSVLSLYLVPAFRIFLLLAVFLTVYSMACCQCTSVSARPHSYLLFLKRGSSSIILRYHFGSGESLPLCYNLSVSNYLGAPNHDISENSPNTQRCYFNSVALLIYVSTFLAFPPSLLNRPFTIQC